MTRFPEAELLEHAAATPVPAFRQILHDAVEAQNELRERCLLAELRCGILAAEITTPTVPTSAVPASSPLAGDPEAL